MNWFAKKLNAETLRRRGIKLEKVKATEPNWIFSVTLDYKSSVT